MKILHVLKTEPDPETDTLMRIISEGEETATFALYEADPDYGKLLDLLFDSEHTISWW